MANNNRGRTHNHRSSDNNDSGVREVVGGYAGGFMESVKARPLRAAAIAAGAAGASAFLWARRAQLADQVSSLSDSISERFTSDDSGSRSAGGSTSSAGSTGIGGASSIDPMRS